MGVPGKAYLIGAGPGDPGLLTVRAVELLGRCDVVLYDRLIPAGALDSLVATGTELVYVGKEPGRPSMAQDEINARLVELARAGRTVGRLKGGDPFVFGRGGEEAEALAGAGVRFEVVPGITAGVAAPAYAGIPITHRDGASAVAFVTGHEDPDKPEPVLDWDALAAFPGTLVFYMGVRNLEPIAWSLVEAGRPEGEPVAVIERGTTGRQRTATGTLGDIAARVAEAGIKPPAITVVGAVVDLREELAWFEQGRPLMGKTVVVTRAREQASALAERLSRELGAEVVAAPVITTEPLAPEEVDPALGPIDRYDLICLTSRNAIDPFFAALRRRRLDARALAAARIAVIGSSTAALLAERGIDADVVPGRQVAEGLIEALAGEEVDGRRVLVARAAEGRDLLPDALRERGAQVDVVALYRTLPLPPSRASLEAAARADYVTFTSSSTVRYFVEAIGDAFPRAARIVSIGPATSATARELGLEVHVEAARHDVDGLIEALLEDARSS
jgi:uroporphyrinogen III methyltransferase/synthase